MYIGTYIFPIGLEINKPTAGKYTVRASKKFGAPTDWIYYWINFCRFRHRCNTTMNIQTFHDLFLLHDIWMRHGKHSVRTLRIPMSPNRKFQKFNLNSAEAKFEYTWYPIVFAGNDSVHVYNLNWNANMNIWNIMHVVCCFSEVKLLQNIEETSLISFPTRDI